MNDTTRQVGGALGVAVLGSVLASSYASAMAPAVQGLPAAAASQPPPIRSAARRSWPAS